MASPAFAQTTQPAFPFDGEITGDGVYVRSGPGSNYYPTTRLQTGDRVRVLGEQFTWMRIAPPVGSFSFVDMTLVEKTSDEEGTIKGDKVNVYAGSSLVGKKHEVQTQLDKGARVAIKGDMDGFYKILPPETASLWVSGRYVRPATGAPRKPRPAPATAPAVAATGPAPAAPGRQVTAPSKPVAAPADTDNPPDLADAPASAGAGSTDSQTGAEAQAPNPDEPVARASQPVTLTQSPDGSRTEVRSAELTGPSRLEPFLRGGGTYADQVRALEARLHTAMTTASLDKSELTAIQSEYATIAAQDAEPVAKAIADARVKQLGVKIALLISRDGVLADQTDLGQYRVKLGAERDAIQQQLRSGPSESGLDYRGELRTTLVFPPETNTYRLVDTTGKISVVAYVRVPAPLNKNIERLLGQYVTVRAAKREYNPTGVPLITAADIVSSAPMPRSEPASRPAGG